MKILVPLEPLTPSLLAVAIAGGTVGALWYEVYKRAHPRRVHHVPDHSR